MSGYVDVISTHEILGWSDTKVQIVVNGRHIADVTPDTDRIDAVRAGHRLARGFYFCPIDHLVPGENQIEIRSQAGAALPNGRAKIYCSSEEKVDARWSNYYMTRHEKATRWWQCERIVQHVNKRVCGEPLSTLPHGIFRLLQQRLPHKVPIHRAVSVGCGTGNNEMAAITYGVIQNFDLFELSESAVELGRTAAAQSGFSERMRFQQGNAFELVPSNAAYDAVFWFQALHHMPDVDAALAWSKRVLKPGGVLLMDDFIGPTRMQWSDRLLDINTKYRMSLPHKYLADPSNCGRQLPTKMERATIDQMIGYDPSECADSERIVGSLRKHFPGVEVILKGGGIYHLGLNDVLYNIVEAGDEREIDRALALDDSWLDESHYAVAIAVKQ
jgi:ubiquinone/menaquinone biosynthesis C-methylase UbiE